MGYIDSVAKLCKLVYRFIVSTSRVVKPCDRVYTLDISNNLDVELL